MKPGMLWTILAVFLATTTLGTLAPKPPTASSPPVVDLLDDGKPIDLWFHRDGDTLRAALALSYVNKGGSTAIARVYAVGQNGDATIPPMVITPAADTLTKFAPRAKGFELAVAKTLPSVATLVIRFDGDSGTTPTFLNRPIHASLSDPPAFLFLVIMSVGLSVIVVLVGYSQSPKNAKLNTEMGRAEWDFKSSWASNITIIGAVITTVLAFSALPNVTQHLSRSMYESINLLWTLVITLAPAVYSFFRRQADDLDPDLAANAPPIYHGFVAGFLGACLFTLWAVFGQLGTLSLLLDELSAVHLLPRFAIVTFWVLIGAIAAGVCYYGYRSIIETLEHQIIANQRRQAIKPHVEAQAAALDRTKTPLVAYERLATSLRRPVWHPL